VFEFGWSLAKAKVLKSTCDRIATVVKKEA